MSCHARHALLAVLLCALCAPAAAQTIDNNGVTIYRNQRNSGPRVTLDKKKDELYKGMIPGKRDDVEHITRKAAKTAAPNKLTWVGFIPEDRRTRVFFQFADAPNYEQSFQSDRIVLTFNNTKAIERNFLRVIDASFYKRVVRRIETKRRRGKKLTVTLFLRESAQPQFDASGNYLYVDFAHTPKSK